MRPQTIFSTCLLAAGLALPLASPSYANILVSIDKSTQRMLVSVDGVTRYDWPVSTGRPGYDTPSGTFKVNRMDAAHYSKEFDNAFMPDSMFFDLKGHAIHGFNDVPHLGMAVSHGCVRLSPANAATLFSLVKAEGMANITVIIGGHIPRRGPLVASRHRRTEEASRGPMPVAPDYDNQPPAYAPPPNYGRPVYRPYGGSAFPPQPAPVYSYGRPIYAPPPYGGEAYDRPYSPYPY